MKYKEMLKKKDGKDSNGVSISGKPDLAGVIDQAGENQCDVLIAQSRKVITHVHYMFSYHMCHIFAFIL